MHLKLNIITDITTNNPSKPYNKGQYFTGIKHVTLSRCFALEPIITSSPIFTREFGFRKYLKES